MAGAKATSVKDDRRKYSDGSLTEESESKNGSGRELNRIDPYKLLVTLSVAWRQRMKTSSDREIEKRA